MEPTLLILAAGMASRYGSMKQVESFGPSGETIMDYSIYDAIRAGFKKVVFIVREEFAQDFKSIFEPKLKGKIETDYVYQELSSFMNGKAVPADRAKPWGTAHAVLSDSKVSMNFWCFHQSVFGLIEKWFREFVNENIGNPKAEFFIPIIADLFVKGSKGKIKVISTSAQWFGVTYKEDAPIVKESLLKLIRKGEYPGNLWKQSPAIHDR